MSQFKILCLVIVCALLQDNALARRDRNGPPSDWPKGDQWRQEWENHVKPHVSGKRTRTIVTYPNYPYYNPYLNPYYAPYYSAPPVTYQQPIYPIIPPTNASVSSYYDQDGMIVHYYIDPIDGRSYYYSNDSRGNMRYFTYDTAGNKIYYSK